jgi:hypothetical protein
MRTAAIAVLAVTSVVSSACGSSPGSKAGSPLSAATQRGISISFPGGTCGPAKVGTPFSTYIVLQGGIPPYKVTWYVDGHPGALDGVQVEKLGPNLDPIYANGTKYTITFTPKAATDLVTLRAVDSRTEGAPDETESTLIGAGGPCSITP